MHDINKFKLNDLISLRLEEGKTNIYIKGEKFLQCKYLLLVGLNAKNINIDSIDDLENVLSKDLEERFTPQELGLSAREVYFGHCSNLQAWVENDYDTRLLHSNLAFPLLEKLAKLGDDLAKKKLKEEIVKRYVGGGRKVQIYLEDEGYVENYFTKREFASLILPKKQFDALATISQKSLQEFNSLFSLLYYGKNTLNTLELYLKDEFPKELLAFKRTLKKLKIVINKKCSHPQIPTWIGEFNSLEYLEIVGNFKRIPSSLGGLRSLRNLILRGQLSNVPDVFEHLLNLEEITLSGNLLENLPESFGTLENLRNLYLDNNQFKAIPRPIFHLKNLQIFIISENQIKALPEKIKDLPNLGYIRLDEKTIRNSEKITEKLKKKKIRIIS